MKYTDLSDANDFVRNMRRTPWLKLFPHWWDERDPLLKAIGDEVERLKAQAIFTLLNAQIKPPCLIWQNSLVHPEYHVTDNIKQLPSTTQVQAPLYKTWGKITLNNNTKDNIDTLTVMITESDGLVIPQTIRQSDKIIIDLTNQKVTVNDDKITPQTIGEGIPYFKTVQNHDKYIEGTPLHNESIKVYIKTEEEIECDIDIDLQLDDVVFTNEQNIEVTGLELIPIEKIELYVKYDFDFNTLQNGWHKVYEKKYDSNTNVLHDMITKQFYTKEFYVDVWYKTLQYPYQVAFPCYKDAEPSSMYHVNERLDTWGEQLGLERRLYKTDIDEKVYSKTFPPYYPADIEQDYWYYMRLINEYSWNDLAINDVDLKDTEGNNIVRLYSINPFVEDFVVHAKSTYTSDKEYVNFNNYTPILIAQRSSENNNRTQQVPFTNTRNVLKYDDNKASIELRNKAGLNINNLKYMSKELLTYFDLSNLPNDVNIDDIEVLIEADSTDNKTDKYSNSNTGIVVPSLYEDGEETFIPLTADKSYQLAEQTITYSSNQLQEYIKKSLDTDTEIKQTAKIGAFKFAKVGTIVKIPFELTENDKPVDDIYKVWAYFKKDDDDKGRLIEGKYANGHIEVVIPPNELSTKITIVCKSSIHAPFTTTIDISTKTEYKTDENGQKIPEYRYINGPLVNNKASDIQVEEKWHTTDFRNILQRQGLYFRNIYENNNAYSSTRIDIKNVTLKISYSPKKTNFTLQTSVHKKSKGSELGKYNVSITNTGEKQLHTNIDIINPPNIKLNENFITVDLDVGETLEKTIDIFAQMPIDDGFYDILTVCEDTTLKDIIEVSSQGLIQTSINFDYHHTKYNQETTLTAYISTGNLSVINSNIKNLSFYVDGYLVGTTEVYNNQGQVTFTPSEKGITKTGALDLEVKYSGSSQYKSSHKKGKIFISKDKSNIIIDAMDTAPYQQEYSISVDVLDDDGKNITTGKVEYYFDDIYMGLATSNKDNKFVLEIEQLDIHPGKYTLYARYIGDDNYSNTEESMPITVIGGDVTLYIDDIESLPTQTHDIIVQVLDEDYNLVPAGYIDINIDELNIQQENIKVINGRAHSTIEIIDAPEGVYTINIKYKTTQKTGYTETTTTATLTVSKHIVKIERYAPYQGTQYEPLGFLFKITDAETGELVTDGKISLTVLQENWRIPDVEVNNGYARIIHNPISMQADEWTSLSKYKFFVGKDYPTIIDTITQEEIDINNIDGFDINIYSNVVDNLSHLFGIWSGEGSFPNAENSDDYFEINKDGHLLYHSSSTDDDDISEFLIIDKEGHLIRLSSDKHRTYEVKDYDLEILFKDSSQYKNRKVVLENGLHIDENHNINLDMLSYKNLSYNSDIDTVCYVTDNEGNDIESGQVIFKLDNQKFYTSNVENGIAKIPKQHYVDIKQGTYLLEAMYQRGNNIVHTYVDYEMEQIKPTIKCKFSNKDMGQKSNIIVTLKNSGQVGTLNGFLNIFLDNEKINSVYLYGNENHPGFINDVQVNYNDDNDIEVQFVIDIPTDINEHTLTIVYEGNELIQSVTKIEKFTPELAKVNLVCPPSIMAYNQTGILDIYVHPDNYIINEGYIKILKDNTVVAKSAVINNKASLKWTPQENTGYSIKYEDATLYECKDVYIIINQEGYGRLSGDKDTYLIVDIIPPQDIITINDKETRYRSLQSAVQCLSDNGTINIEKDYIITESVDINKNVNIKGVNGSSLIKDLPTLLNLSELKVYSSTDNLYEVEGLSKDQFNNQDFIIKDNDIYTSINYDKLYLMSNDKIYAEKKLTAQSILTDTVIKVHKDASLHIDDLILESNDNDINKYRIDNSGTLDITYSILKDNLKINNIGFLSINNSLVYCQINSNKHNLDNNWWGSNTCPFDVNNHMILKLSTDKEPPVISEDITILGELIGANNRHYDIPNVKFELESETGYFGINSGVMINGQIETSYMDATKESVVTLTVDKQSIETTIYDYARKTEIIIDSIPEIPYKYYIPIKAEIKSCADSYYDSDRIINGHINFYLNNKQVGHVPIKNNIATLVLYSKYDSGKYELKAVYEPDNYYFASESTLKFEIFDNNNAVYVSPEAGDDYGTGNFDSPFLTIQKALETDKNTIYLKDDVYNESLLDINKKVKIKSYCNNVTFKNKEDAYIFKTQTNDDSSSLYLSNITFDNNKNIFAQDSRVKAEECIFTNNEKIFKESDDIEILYSAIVNNKSIADDITSSNFKYCWFGTNNPRDKINANINNYIIMKLDSTKKLKNNIVLYDGIVTRLTAQLKHYKYHSGDNEYEYTLKHSLPLRVANFMSKDFLFNPKKDYTYNNYATSLLDTHQESDNNKLNIKITGTTQYINKDVKISCQVTNQLNEPINDEYVNFLIKQNNQIDINESIQLTNGKATLTTKPLKAGEYILECSCNGYTKSETLIVKKESLWIDSLQISDSDNAHNMSICAVFKNSLSNIINDEYVNIFIDDDFIQKTPIINNNINTTLHYSMIEAGRHLLRIEYEKNTYDAYQYETSFISKEKETEIIFDYDYIKANTVNEFDIYIRDNEKPVTKGYLSILFDNEKIIEDVHIINGYYLLSLPALPNNEIKQHSIIIIYDGYDGYYTECVLSRNMSSGAYGINSDLPDIVYGDMDKPLEIDTKITDVNSKPVFKGHADIYINNILVNQTNISNSHIIASCDLPYGIKPGKHSLRIEYTDNTNVYQNTTIRRELEIKTIDTIIELKPYTAYPNEEVTIEYNIASNYGDADIGTITFEIEGKKYSKEVSDGLFNQITFKAPNYPAGIYDMTVTYKDKNNIYSDSTLDTKFVLSKNSLSITPSHTWYYPKKPFIFTATFTNKDGLMANNGYASLYIDGVKEESDIKVIDGQASTYMEFDDVREYDIVIVYESNEYHERTPYQYTFTTKSIPIDKIDLSYDDELIKKVQFTTKDGINVCDGILKLTIDKNITKTFTITEDNKDLDWDISSLSKGSHNVRIEYYGSSLFNTYCPKDDYIITKNPKKLKITIIDKNEDGIIYAKTDSYATIPIELTDTVSGIIKYYLTPITENQSEASRQYVGMANIKNVNKYNFELNIPVSLTYPSYIIEAKFEANEYYDKAFSNALTLNIIKHQPTIKFNDIDAKYQEYIDLGIDTDIEDNLYLRIYDNNTYHITEETDNDISVSSSSNHIDLALNKAEIDVQTCMLNKENNNASYYTSLSLNDFDIEVDTYIKDKKLLETGIINTTSDNGYQLSDKLTAGSYTIEIYYPGSVYYEEYYESHTLNIEPYQPIMNQNDIYTPTHIGDAINLKSIVKNINGAPIFDTGHIRYVIDDIEYDNTFDLNTEVNIPLENTEVKNIKCYYISDNTSKYLDAEIDIEAIYNKNDIMITDVSCTDNSSNIVTSLYRGGEYNITATILSTSTDIVPNNIEYNIYLDSIDKDNKLCNGSINNGKISNTIAIPLDKPYEDRYTVIIDIKESDIFNYCQEEIVFINRNQDTINVDPKIKTEAFDTVKTLSKAIELINEYGTINIKNDITTGENIISDKNITIHGEGNTLMNCSITNNANLSIDDATFAAAKNTDPNIFIINNKKATISSCTFKDNKTTTIKSNHTLDITNSKFTSNKAQSGACIYIEDKNHHTKIDNCHFSENNALNYGSCIYSNKGNNLSISKSSFTNNTSSNNTGGCICVKGNIYISSTSFYNNTGACEIRLDGGSLEIDKSLFDNTIQPIQNNIQSQDNNDDDIIKADTNYWGTSNVKENQYTKNLPLNSWVVGSYSIAEYENEYGIKVLVDKYINISEKETKTIENLDNNFPVELYNTETPETISTTLNKEEIISKDDINNIVITIGKKDVLE